MATEFPTSNDVFTEPSSPGSTALSSAGTGSRNHTQHHRDYGDAIEAMQAQATRLAHSHDGSTARHGSKLAQAVTHETPDTDALTTSLHHTLGTGNTQAAAGNHTHTQANSHNSPDTDSATSALHHTIGTGANQAAAGDHVHSHPIILTIKASTTFSKGDYPGLYAIDVEIVGGGGGSGYTAATAASKLSWGMGGTGAGYARKLILAASLSSSETITIGAGGTAGDSTNKNGGDGGSSSFGSFIGAGGGAGGGNQPSHTPGGTSFGQGFGGDPTGSYDIGIRGVGLGQVGDDSTPGFPWLFNAGGLDGQPSGGPYGSLIKCPYALGRGHVSGSAVAGRGYGSGAQGTFNYASLSAKNGAAGSAGICVIRLIF